MDFDIGDCPMSFQKKKTFVLKHFFIHGKGMCERVSEDLRHGAWNVDIHVEMFIFLLEWVLMCES